MVPGRFLTKNITGVTIVELMVAVTIILLVVVPLSRVLFHSMKGAMSFGDANKAVQLAQDLMEEIKQKKWDENEPLSGDQTPLASYSPQPLGREGTELAPDLDGSNGAKVGGSPADPIKAWDDIDDYNGLVENPPKDIAGNDIPNPGNPKKFTRMVEVKYVTIPETNPATILPLGIGTTHYKQIIVKVDWAGRVGGSPVTITSIRANVKRY